MAQPQTQQEAAQDLLSFLNANPTMFHVVETVRTRLEAAGFAELCEANPWSLKPGGRYYFVRHDATIIAFVVGSGSVAEHGFRMVAAHTDSPGYKVKPLGEIQRHGFAQLGVEIYGGPIHATWTDRDLTLAGRVYLRSPGAPWGAESRLLHIDRPLLSIPNVAIHLNRAVNDEGLKLNPQHHLPPFLFHSGEGHEGFLKQLLAEELDVDADSILSHELYLADTQKGVISGWKGEFIHSGRLDNQAMCHSCLGGFLQTVEEETPWTRMAVLYDSEEIGSQTPQGADSPILAELLERIVSQSGAGGREEYFRACRQSVLISADMAHGLHPNYADKHDPQHQPRLNGGPTLKLNANARYMTDGLGTAIFEQCCQQAGVSCQYQVSRSDMRTGSTIGPITVGQTGLRTLDVGNPMLAMHSIRETAGTADAWAMIQTLAQFLTSDWN